MEFKPDNPVTLLCIQGMEKEGEGDPAKAAQLFEQAWNEAWNNFEKFTAAHYVARHQQRTEDKLKWDLTALELAGLSEEDVTTVLPSLYLNVAKGYEDLGDLESARNNYILANSFAARLPDDEYSKMIRFGISNGLKRVNS